MAPLSLATYGMTPPMAARFEALAIWHAECQRGIVHTPEWDAAMADLQREFDQQQP